MAFEDFFNHRCDIYHLAEETVTVNGVAIASSTKKQAVVAEEQDVPCHFHINGEFLDIVQREPQAELQGRGKLSLPFGTDIRKNDIVRSRETGFCYRADLPRVIHGNHHIVVELRREDGAKGAI